MIISNRHSTTVTISITMSLSLTELFYYLLTCYQALLYTCPCF